MTLGISSVSSSVVSLKKQPHASLPAFLYQVIKEKHTFYVLERQVGDTNKAFEILESIPEDDIKLDICEKLLMKKMAAQSVVFVISYMLTYLSAELSVRQKMNLICTKMGTMALMSLPEHARPDYEHLVSKPELLLEQLLMNTKIEWATKVLNCFHDDQVEEYCDCASDDFDDLLSVYAAKALEFKVVDEPDSDRE